MHKGKRHFFLAALLAIAICAGALSLLISGCSGLLASAANDDPISASYKTLKAAAILYDEALTAAAELHALGLIDNGQRDEVIQVGNRFRAAWQASVAMLHGAAIADAPDMPALERQMALFEAIYSELRVIARPYLIRMLADKEQ